MRTPNHESRIAVPETTLNIWKAKLKHGDKVAIAARFGLRRVLVGNAFEGLATPTLIKHINEYYQVG